VGGRRGGGGGGWGGGGEIERESVRERERGKVVSKNKKTTVFESRVFIEN